MARSSALSLDQRRILAGVLVDEALNFRFEVWAYWRMSSREVERHYRQWSRQPDRPADLRDKTVRLVTNFGIESVLARQPQYSFADFGPSFFGVMDVAEQQS